MTTAFSKTKLGECCEVTSGYPFPSDEFSQNPEDIPLVKGENLSQQRILWEQSRYWPREHADGLDRFRLLPEDIVLAMDRPWVPAGLKVAWIKDGDPEALLVQRVARLRAAAHVDQQFLRYVLLSPEFTAYIQSAGRGVGVPHISGRQIQDFEFKLPALGVQRRIGDILSAYDDLIENNTRRMALLEQSARLLYEEWFVRLRFPGREHTRITAGVPAGWKRQPLENVAEFRLGKMLDQKKNKGDLMPYLANVNVRWGSFELCDLREMRFEDDEFEAFGLKFGDIVMCEGGEPGRCAIWKEQMPRMMVQKALHRIRCRQPMPHEFLYYTLRHLGHTGYLATLFTGATIKHLPREKLALVTVVVPPAKLLELFTSYVRPIEEQLNVLEAANRRAAAARDLLLPRLMSGEVAI